MLKPVIGLAGVGVFSELLISYKTVSSQIRWILGDMFYLSESSRAKTLANDMDVQLPT